MGYERSGKAIYFKNTSENGNTESILIADVKDEETAAFIINRLNSHSSKFIPLAIRTCSPDFHGDKVSMAQFKGRINGAIDALNKLDQVKKSLFYGRDNNLISEGQSDASAIVENMGGIDNAVVRPIAIDVVHAILGIATEAGELLEALRNAYNGKPLDWVNIKEEYGDLAWYEALLAKSGDYEFEEIWQLIIKKLIARYPDKYSSELANERDLETERAVLEGSDMAMAPTLPASGPEAVTAVEANADAVFNKLDNIQSDTVEQPTGTDSELAKPRGYRERPLDDEHIARQPIRREDS